MYKLYADRKGWKYELLSCTPSELGGFKEYIMVIAGHNVHRLMRYEAGTHRVQGSSHHRVAVLDIREINDMPAVGLERSDVRLLVVEAALEEENVTLMAIPADLVPEVRTLLARKESA